MFAPGTGRLVTAKKKIRKIHRVLPENCHPGGQSLCYVVYASVFWD